MFSFRFQKMSLPLQKIRHRVYVDKTDMVWQAVRQQKLKHRRQHPRHFGLRHKENELAGSVSLRKFTIELHCWLKSI